MAEGPAVFELGIEVCGVHVDLRTDDARLFELIRPSFPRPTDRVAAGSRQVTIAVFSERSEAGDAELERLRAFAARHPLDGGRYVCRRSPDGIHYGDHHATWWLGAQSCCCLVDLPAWSRTEAGYNAFYYLILRPMLYELLWRQSCFMLHAAAVEHARSGPLLVIGDRGHGKSTIAVALAARGHRLLTDDTVYFRATRSGACELQTVERELHLHPDLGVRFPELAGLASRAPYAPGETKVAVGLREVFPDRVVERLSGARVLVFPRIAARSDTSVHALTRAEAAWRMLCHCYTGLVDPEGRATGALVGTAAGIVAGAEVLGLTGGRDAHADPDRYVSALESALAARGVG